jgi:hypothetical protein
MDPLGFAKMSPAFEGRDVRKDAELGSLFFRSDVEGMESEGVGEVGITFFFLIPFFSLRFWRLGGFFFAGSFSFWM